MEAAIEQIRKKSQGLQGERERLKEQVNRDDKELGELGSEWQRVESQRDEHVALLKTVEE